MEEKAKKSFFFEIFSEEIPARMQKKAIVDAEETIQRILGDYNIVHGTIEVSIAPRRIYVCVDQIETETAPFFEEKRGPRVTVNEQALEGFLRKNQLNKKDLTEKDGYFFAKREIPAQKFKDKIPAIFHEFLNRMPWMKSMRWYNETTKTLSRTWVRPIRSVVCLFGNECVQFKIEGCDISSSDITYGHHFLSPNPLKITSFEQYKQILKDHYVLVNYDQRQQAIVDIIQQKIAKLGLELKQNQALLDEITGLVDYPFPVIGHIEKKFMMLPEEVLETSMKVHQKYFCTLNSDGSLASFFIGISNQPESTDIPYIQQGMEKVLKARLSDAMFFYQSDLKASLESRQTMLDQIVFHEKLGSLKQKIERMVQISPETERAIRLCKLDLVTDMVREFEELQGIIGAHYAIKQEETLEIAQAIEDHYHPNSQEDRLPRTLTGVKVALVDRVDTLVGFLGVGIRPTGSKDPFALRRSALGVIRILLEKEGFNLVDLLKKSIAAYQAQQIALKEDVFENVIDFIKERLSFYLKDQKGIRYDIIQSVIAFYLSKSETFDIQDIYQRVSALQAFLCIPNNEQALMLFRRLSGILAQAAEDHHHIDPALFEYPEEKEVWETLEKVHNQSSVFLANKEYQNVLDSLLCLLEPYNAFFNAVQINTDDIARRNVRLALLQYGLALYQQITDFSKIQENGVNHD